MKLLKSFGKLRRLKLVIRQVTGESMMPGLRNGQVIIGSGHFRSIKVGDVVVISHDNLEKIKRVTKLNSERGIFVTGDNSGKSIDSRHFGWLPEDVVVAKVVWPQTTRH